MVTVKGGTLTSASRSANSSAVRPSMSPAKRTVTCISSGCTHFAPEIGARSNDSRIRSVSGTSMAVKRRGIGLASRAGGLACPHAGHQLLHHRQDALRDLGDTLGIGMDAVLEIEPAVEHHTMEE